MDKPCRGSFGAQCWVCMGQRRPQRPLAQVYVDSAPQTLGEEPVHPASSTGSILHVMSFFSRDDAFSDSLRQKADSEASSGPLLDDKASSKNDLQSPTEHISDYGFGGVMGR